MTNEGHFESAAYMIRNLYTGDGEQTRIEDEQYMDELPRELAIACKYLADAKDDEDYEGACFIYIRWHLLQVVKYWWEWDKKGHKEEFLRICNVVYDRLWGLDEDGRKELTKEEVEEIEGWRDTDMWVAKAEELLKG